MKRKALPRNTTVEKKPKLQSQMHTKATPKIELEQKEEKQPIPTRDKKTGRLVFKDHPEFRPNLTPKEVLQAGTVFNNFISLRSFFFLYVRSYSIFFFFQILFILLIFLGSFGGTYFRPIYSSVTKQNYKDAHKEVDY